MQTTGYGQAVTSPTTSYGRPVLERLRDKRGTLTRLTERVYRIGNYDRQRMLRGWTRPVNRIVTDMRAAGDIPAAAEDLLEPIYDNDVKAGRFRDPADLAIQLDDE
ncbi:hypothetical protein BH20ACT5_BH20ACT5_07540 [soil metagenome]